MAFQAIKPRPHPPYPNQPKEFGNISITNP
jgi:hypothetical protein